MKRIPVLLGAVALAAAAFTSSLLAQTSPGPILVTDAQSTDLYPSWGTNTLMYAEYYCINNFNTNFVAPNGVTFVANKPRVGGSGTWGAPPALANDTYGFGTMMGGDQWAGTMNFSYPVATGDSYLLELLFYDDYQTTVGARVFDVGVNGVTIVSTMDLAALGAGKGANAIIVLPIELDNIAGNSIQVQLAASVNNATISGAILYGLQHVQPAQALATGPYDPNLSITNSYNNFTPTNFLYAEYYGNNLTNPMTIDGLTFTLNNARLPGTYPYGPAYTPDFGATSDGTNLALISANDDWLPSGTDDSLSLPTQAGRDYMLQLLFHDNAYSSAFKRQFNVLSGPANTTLTNWVSNLDLAYAGAYLTQPTDVVLTVTVPGDGNNFVVQLQHGAADNPLLSAMTWQEISPGVGVPIVLTAPVGTNVFQGRTALLSAVAVDANGAPMTYQWYSGTHGNDPSTFTPVTGANVSGATTNTLTITNIALGQSDDYAFVASNVGGSVTSSVAYVDVLLTNGVVAGTYYSGAIIASNAVDYWRLNEPSGSPMVYDCGPGGKDGVVGSAVSLGESGPEPQDFRGFEANNACMALAASNANDFVTAPPLNLNTNTVTLMAWLYPTNNQALGTGVMLARQGSSGPATGLAYGIGIFPNGDYALRYFWNGVSTPSAAQVPQNIWSLVALAVTSSNASISVLNANGLITWTAAATNAVCAFSDPFLIGNDPADGGNGNRTFAGYIDEVSVFNKALTASQLLTIFTNTTGIAVIPASAGAVTLSPFSGLNTLSIVNPGVSVTLSGSAGGVPAPSLQWMTRSFSSGTYVNVPGATNATLTLSASPANTGDYVLFASNKVGIATSSPGRLLVATSNAPALIGQWLTGNQNDLQDKSGYNPAGLHDGYFVGTSAGTWALGDVPPGFSSGLYSLALNGAAAVAITNTSDATTLQSGDFLDGDYRIDFDNNITNRFTIAFWAKGFPSANYAPFCSKNGETPGWQLRHNQYAGVPTFTVRGLSDNNPDASPGAAARVTDSGWHHWCGTYDSYTGWRHLYLDGVDVQQLNGEKGGWTPANAYHMVLGGKENPGIGNYFAGSFFDVRVYNYAVAPAEVQGMMTPGNSGAVGLYFDAPTPLPVGQPEAFTVVIPVGANKNGPVNVWVTNLAPAVASVRNVALDANNAFRVTFAQNAPNTQSFILDTIGTGAISFALGNDASLSSLAVASVNVILPQMVGHWLTGASNLVDTALYIGSGVHDGVASPANSGSIGSATAKYTNSVPPGFPPGGSLFLDGTYAVTINGSSTLGSGYYPTFDTTIAEGFSVAFWAEGLPNGAWGPWISKHGEIGNDPGWSVLEYNNINAPCFTINKTADNAYPNTEGSSTYIANFGTAWHHFVATWDNWTGLRKLYVDGQLSLWVGQDYGPLPPASNDYLVIGGEDLAGVPSSATSKIDANCFKGAMYDVRVYNYALSAGEVKTVMMPSGVTTLAAAADTKVIDQGTTGTVSFSLPPGATASGPVTVTVANNNPTVASIAGGITSVTFPMGSPTNTMKLTLNGLSDGQATITVSAPGLTSASATVQVLAPSHLVGRWLVGAGNLTEYSGFQPAGTHDGTVMPTTQSVSWASDAPADYLGHQFPGRAILFNGSDAVLINNSAKWDAGYASSFDEDIGMKFTVTFWTKGPDQANWVAFVSKRGDDGIGWYVRRYNSKHEDFALRQTALHGQSTGASIEDMNNSGTSLLFDSKWHHCAAVWDGYAGTRVFYVDGAQDDGMSLAGDFGPNALASNHHLVFGGEEANTVLSTPLSTTWSHQNGLIANLSELYDVRIYNYPLTLTQITNVMTAPAAPQLSAQLVPGGSVQLSWPAANAGYTVQTSPVVLTSGTPWVASGLAVTLQNGRWTATDSAPGAGPRYYRLVLQ